MCKCLKFMNCTFMPGRPQAAPDLKEDEKLDVDDDIETEETRDEVLESWKRGLDHYDEEEAMPALEQEEEDNIEELHQLEKIQTAAESTHESEMHSSGRGPTDTKERATAADVSDGKRGCWQVARPPDRTQAESFPCAGLAETISRRISDEWQRQCENQRCVRTATRQGTNKNRATVATQERATAATQQSPTTENRH